MKLDWQRSWAHTVAPKQQILCGLGSDDGIFVNFGIRGVLLSVSFYSDVVLDSGLFYFNNFKFGTQNATEVHNSGQTRDLGASKQLCALGRTSSGAQDIT